MDSSPPVSVPRLLTPRLLLREYRAQDFDAFAANLADPEATVYLGACDRQTAWRIFGCQAGIWMLQGAGWWMVESRASGQVVGTVGAFFRESMAGIELGWNTYRAHWNQGLASEAAAAALRYVLDVRREPEVKALVDARNAPSIRVALRLGLRHAGKTELFGKTIGRYVLSNGEGPRNGATSTLE